MRWERLNGRDFEAAIKKTGGVCALPWGSMERHGEHLPLGTDTLIAHEIALRAAEKEPVVVYPGQHWAQVCESMSKPGTIAVRPELVMELLRELCAEIARNGFKKIVVVNGHGGNGSMLEMLAFSDARQPRDYLVYYTSWYAGLTPAQQQAMAADYQGRPIGHACEWETSLYLALGGPEGVNLNYAPTRTIKGRDLGDGVAAQAKTSVDWFAHSPLHYLGNARYATAARGRRYAKLYIERLADLFRAVKADQQRPALQQEYFRLSRPSTARRRSKR